MNQYALSRIWVDSASIGVVLTEYQGISFSWLQKMYPNIRIKEGPLANARYYDIDKLGGNGSEISWAIIKYMCENGWEPFSVGPHTGEYYFRRVK